MYSIRVQFPSLASTRVELLRMQPIIRSTQATRRSLRSLWIRMVLFQALIWAQTNTRHIPSVHDIDIEISQKILDIDIDISRQYRIICREF